LWFGISASIVAVCVVAVTVFNIKLGIDFTGGTFMQLNFEQEVTREELATSLEEIGRDISTNGVQVDSEEAAPDTTLITSPVEIIDLGSASIIPADDGFIIKTKYITSDVHDEVISKLTERYGTIEESRFTTVGPVVGETMKFKAGLDMLMQPSET